MKNLLARKWDTVKDRPVTARPRGLMVTKRQILQVVSLAGAAPGFLELRNHSRGLDLQKASWEKAFFPCRGIGGAGVVVLLLKSEMWTLVSRVFTPTVRQSLASNALWNMSLCLGV